MIYLRDEAQIQVDTPFDECLKRGYSLHRILQGWMRAFHWYFTNVSQGSNRIQFSCKYADENMDRYL